MYEHQAKHLYWNWNWTIKMQFTATQFRPIHIYSNGWILSISIDIKMHSIVSTKFMNFENFDLKLSKTNETTLFKDFIFVDKNETKCIKLLYFVGYRSIKSGFSTKAVGSTMVKKITWIFCWKSFYGRLWRIRWFTSCSWRR